MGARVVTCRSLEPTEGQASLPKGEDRKEAALGPKLDIKRKQPWSFQITGAQAEKTQRPWHLAGLSFDGGVSCLLPRMEPLGPDSREDIRGNDEKPLLPSHRDSMSCNVALGDASRL